MTKPKTPAQLLERAIENALLSAQPGEKIEDQASRVIGEEPEIIDALTPEWQLREVVRLFRLKRLEDRTAASCRRPVPLTRFRATAGQHYDS